jgi:hypothetical protein
MFMILLGLSGIAYALVPLLYHITRRIVEQSPDARQDASRWGEYVLSLSAAVLLMVGFAAAAVLSAMMFVVLVIT